MGRPREPAARRSPHALEPAAPLSASRITLSDATAAFLAVREGARLPLLRCASIGRSRSS